MRNRDNAVAVGVHWHERKCQWMTTLENPSGGTRTEFHDCLLDAVASRLRFEKKYWITGGMKAMIFALEQENTELRQRIRSLEFRVATTPSGGWTMH